jgi:uncharacterized protein
MVWISPTWTKRFSIAVIPSHNSSKRWVAIGVSIRGVIVVVFARLGREGISIVSMRPASRNERKLYAER